MLLYFYYITAFFINVCSVTEKNIFLFWESQVELVKSLIVDP